MVEAEVGFRNSRSSSAVTVKLLSLDDYWKKGDSFRHLPASILPMPEWMALSYYDQKHYETQVVLITIKKEDVKLKE